MPVTTGKEAQLMKALEYLIEHPGSRIAAVAKLFNVQRLALNRRYKGTGPRIGIPATNTKLTRPEERALCKYIDRLDAINLSLRREYIIGTANLILSKESPKGRNLC